MACTSHQHLKPCFRLVLSLSLAILSLAANGAKNGVPDRDELGKPFGDADRKSFSTPARIHYPETWFHYIGGNVSKEGITADLEAIAAAGISGVQLFHGQFGDKWPATGDPIACLSDRWEEAVRHTADECRRLGLRFTMQNCPGWAMAGGPWISPENAMRTLVYSTTYLSGDGAEGIKLPLPEPSEPEWRDYRDIAVLAFPTPAGDLTPLVPIEVTSTDNLPWKDLLSGDCSHISLSPSQDKGYTFEVAFDGTPTVRTIVFPSVESLSHAWCYDPDIHFTVQAITGDNESLTILDTEIPASNWQDGSPLSLACREAEGAKAYRVTIRNGHYADLRRIRFLTAALKNNWEAEAAQTLRDVVRSGEHVHQNDAAYISSAEIVDISKYMSPDGTLSWKAPRSGKWTVMRLGHVNAGRRNGPAPEEGTGWECDKLSPAGAETHFAGYIGRLADGTLNGGALNGMLLDSWECGTQTWTPAMEEEFAATAGYALRNMLPALTGYIIDSPETTARFLNDWRCTISRLYTDNFYRRISDLGHKKGLTVAYETAAGDVFPADIMEYFKFADIPMCEYWQPFTEGYVGWLNFKPIRPAASAAHLYGKPRLAAEAFTSFELTWNEHWEKLKEVADYHAVEGVTHNVFHTYTHNPQIGYLQPGSSFGAGIGTPFLRGQTWWRHMPAFTSYMARCSYMLERGKPVTDVLWYLGDEITHKPSQFTSFPDGFRYDYCNPDVLLNRLKVKDGKLVTPEGLEYKLLWLGDNRRMRPETIERLLALIRAGATVAGNAPEVPATLSGGEKTMARFKKSVEKIWGKSADEVVTPIGKGRIIAGADIETALALAGLQPDVKGGVRWIHRTADGADWYFVTPQKGEAFNGSVSFRSGGNAELWDPITGKSVPLAAKASDGYTSVDIDLPQGGSAFVVFDRSGSAPASDQAKKPTNTLLLADGPEWTIEFPDGWDAPKQMKSDSLRYWKDFDISPEGKSFSGTAVYTTSFNLPDKQPDSRIILDLGEVDMIAQATVNGKDAGTVWCHPYRIDITDAACTGENTLKIEVTGTWFNRLVYDASLPVEQRRTWTVNGPSKDAPLCPSGLAGPVKILY